MSMNRNFNLPPGVTMNDIDGPPLNICERCGNEFNGYEEETLCEECLEKEGEKFTNEQSTSFDKLQQ